MESIKISAESPLTRTAKSSPGVAARKRETILHAAADCIAEAGYHNTTLQEVASRIGTQAGSLYYHFASRDALVEEILVRGISNTFSATVLAVESLPESATSRDKLSAAIECFVSATLENCSFAKAAYRSIALVPENVRAAANGIFESYTRYLNKLIRLAMQDGFIDPEIPVGPLRLLILGAASLSIEWYLPTGATSVQQIGELLSRLVFSGAAPPERHPIS